MKERERKIISDPVCAAEKPKAKGVTKHLDNTFFSSAVPSVWNLQPPLA